MFPTIVRSSSGEVVLIPTLPELSMVMTSVAPLLPVRKCMSAPVVPTPEVVLKERSEVVSDPPTIKGEVMLVANVGLSLNTATPVPVSSERESVR